MSRNSNPSRFALAVVQSTHAGFRADRALCALMPGMNRRAAKQVFKDRLIKLNGKVATGNERVATGDRLEFPNPEAAENQELLTKVVAPKLTTPHGRHLTRIFEDAHLLVISKPAEIPVHRGQGGFTRRDTLEDVLGRAYPPRGGEQGYWFVHRLDMETSGCLLIAKNAEIRDALIKMFSERRMQKEYLAIVAGSPSWEKIVVKKPIKYIRAVEDETRTRDAAPAWLRAKTHKQSGVLPMKGQKKGVALDEGDEEGKAAETTFEPVERFKGFALVRAQPRTGRTHQIRVHLASLHHPLAYDPLYGRGRAFRFDEIDARSAETRAGDEVVLNRLPLHAWKLGFKHPVTGAQMKFEAPLPRDLKELLRMLRKYRLIHQPPGTQRTKRGRDTNADSD